MSNDNPYPESTLACGCLPRSTLPGQYLPIPGDLETAPLIPRHQMTDLDLSAHDAPTIDQNPQSSCTAAALTTAFRHARAVAGLPLVDLAWSTLYGPSNGGRDAGSPIDVAVNHLMRVGICPQRVDGRPYIDPFDWQGYYAGTWPADWQDQAKGYRLLECWDCPSWEHFLSAMHHGFTGVLGVWWTARSGHAVTPTGYDKVKRRVRIQNTWGPAWQDRGYGWIDESKCIQGIPYFGGFIVRAVSFANTDPLPPLPR